MSIKIKKSKQGSLHTHLGVPQGKKIPANKLKIKSTDSPAIRKKKQFAINSRKWKHEYGGLIPEYSWGGVLADTVNGAGMGAMAGAPVGGIGALPGAIIGGAGAFLKGAVGEITGNKEEKQQLAQQRIAQANNAFNMQMMGGNQNPFTATFAMGGMAGPINAEIEKGETAVSPDGRMRQYSLPSHGQTTGDNFKFFDPGTMIFSDKLKFSKGKTFAQEQMTYKKLSDKADKTLKNPGSTFLNKQTAALNKKNALKMSVDLFGKQEAMKMSKGGRVPKAEYGMMVDDPNFYLGITPINNIQNRFPLPGNAAFGLRPQAQQTVLNIPTTQPIVKKSSTANISSGINNRNITSGVNTTPRTGMDQIMQQRALDNIIFADSFAPAAIPNIAITNTASPLNESNRLANMPSYQPNGVRGGGAGIDWGNMGMQALSLAPDIYNLGQALFSKPEKIERNRYFNPYTNQIRSRMNDRRFNIDPILAANRNANAIYNRNVANASGGDRSRLLSNLLGGMNARQGADAAAYAQKINMDNQYAAEQAQMDFGLGQQNAQALAMRDDINARNMAAKRNFGAAATSGMQRYALNQMQMNNQLASQRAYLDVLKKSNPFFNPWLGLDNLMSYGKNN